MSDSKAKVAIEALLEGKSDSFKATVLELARQLNWDEDDPAFLMAIATHQLEALIQQYPERISEAMARAANELERDWQELQTKLAVSTLKSTQTATQINHKLTDTQLLIDRELSRAERVMKAEREAMLRGMATERDETRRWLADEREAMGQRAQQATEQQQQVLTAQTTALIAQGVVASHERADNQVKDIVNSARAAHFWQSFGWACCAAVALVGLTLFVDGQADRLSDWGRFKSWNQDQLEACRAVDRATCNIHIKPPN